MKLHNTLTQEKETFTPLQEGRVGMYVCGPTVYDRPHIGNARSVVVYDVLYRLLSYIYGQENVTYVRNVTDVDDKINVRAIELGITIQELTSRIYNEFTEDMTYMNCLVPTHEPKATEHMKGMIEIAEKLIANNHAYVSEGHVYFDVTSAREYGCLSGRNLDEMIAGSRVEVSENKRHPGDFVLWKPSSPKDDKSSVFESPWGPGRPGWHIECSAMSSHFLGTDFDIHGGGADLIFPHHTNEIAQSTCAFEGSKFARVWVHNGFLTVNGEKMSKSLGNFITVYDLAQKAVKGEVIRYLLLSTNYRKPLDFNDKALYDAKESLDYLYRALDSLRSETSLNATPSSSSEARGSQDAGVSAFVTRSPSLLANSRMTNVDEQFLSYLEDDLNLSEAFSFMHELAKRINKSDSEDEKAILASKLMACGNLVGLLFEKNWFNSVSDVDVAHIEDLISRRSDAKKARDFGKADILRSELIALGIEIEDRPDGTSIWRKK